MPHFALRKASLEIHKVPRLRFLYARDLNMRSPVSEKEI